MLQLSWQWLNSKEKGRKEIEDYINSLKNSSIFFLGIKCLKADGITTREKLEELRSKQTKNETLEVSEAIPEEVSEKMEEIPKETIIPPATSMDIPGLEIYVKIKNANDAIQEMSTTFCHIFPNLVQELTNISLPALESSRKRELELLEEVDFFSNANRVLEERNRIITDSNSALKKETNDRDKRLGESISKIMELERGLNTQAAEYRKLYQNNKDLTEQLNARDQKIGNLLREHSIETTRLQNRISALERSGEEKILEKFKNFLSAEVLSLSQENDNAGSGLALETEPSELDLVVATATDELPTFCQATNMAMLYSEKFMNRFFKFPDKHQKVIRKKLASFDPNRNSQKSRKLEVDGYIHDWLIPKIRVDWIYKDGCMFFVRIYHKNEVKKL
ncbi:MAG: hypothetical protein WCV59_00610 [Parcubacteria group bacterium]|jgi:hypothetical protein